MQIIPNRSYRINRPEPSERSNIIKPTPTTLPDYQKFRKAVVKNEVFYFPNEEHQSELHWRLKNFLERQKELPIFKSEIEKLPKKDFGNDRTLEFAVSVLEDRTYWRKRGITAGTLKGIFDKVIKHVTSKTPDDLIKRINGIAQVQTLLLHQTSLSALQDQYAKIKAALPKGEGDSVKEAIKLIVIQQLFINRENWITLKLGEGVTVSMSKQPLLQQVPENSILAKFLTMPSKLSNAPFTPTTIDLQKPPEMINTSPKALGAFFEYLSSRKEFPIQYLPGVYRIADYFGLSDLQDLCASRAREKSDEVFYGITSVRLFSEMLVPKCFSLEERRFVAALFQGVRKEKNVKRVNEAIDDLCQSEALPEAKRQILKAMKQIIFPTQHHSNQIELWIPADFKEYGGLADLVAYFPNTLDLRLHIINPSQSEGIHWEGLLSYLIPQEQKKKKEEEKEPLTTFSDKVYPPPKRREIQLVLSNEVVNTKVWEALSKALISPQCTINALEVGSHSPEDNGFGFCRILQRTSPPLKVNLEMLSLMASALKNNKSVKKFKGDLEVVGEGKDSEKAKQHLQVFARLKPQNHQSSSFIRRVPGLLGGRRVRVITPGQARASTQRLFHTASRVALIASNIFRSQLNTLENLRR